MDTRKLLEMLTRNPAAGAAMGGLAGSLLGNVLGGGLLGTAAGAAVGAADAAGAADSVAVSELPPHAASSRVAVATVAAWVVNRVRCMEPPVLGRAHEGARVAK